MKHTFPIIGRPIAAACLRVAMLVILLTAGLLVRTAAAQTASQSPAQKPSTSPPAAQAPKQPSEKANPQPDMPANSQASKPATEQPVSNTASEPTSTSTSTSPSTAVGASSGIQLDGGTYAVRLRDLEQRIAELKEKLRRSHTRLSLLSDTIIGSSGTGAYATVSFENHMSKAYGLTKAVFVLDGVVQFNRSDDSGALKEQKTIPIYRGSLPPGDHTLQVLLEFQGQGYGLFSYLKGYRFEVRSSHSFTVPQGKAIKLNAIAFEKGGITTSLEQRPTVRYASKVSNIDSVALSRPAAAPTKSGKPTSGSFSVGGSVNASKAK